MNKAIIPVLILVLAIVGISGCTDNTPANKTYSANGVSFTYPGNWSELNKTEYQVEHEDSEMIFALGNNQTHLTMAKSVPGANEEMVTLSEWAQDTNTTISSDQYQYLSEKTLTIGGFDAYQLKYKASDDDYVTYMAFVKNNTFYSLVYVSIYDNPKILEDILTTFKMT